MKNIYILKKINEIRLERIYTDNRFKHFKTRNAKNSSTKQIEIHIMLNIVPENSIEAIKKSNINNKNVRIYNEVRNETTRDTIENSNADSQIFEDDVTNDNLLNSKTRNIYARIKSNIHRSNRLIEIENSLNNVERNTSTTAFVTIDKVSIKKK